MNDRKDRYVVRKSEFANRMRDKFGYRKKDVLQFLNDFAEILEEIVLNGEELNLSKLPILSYRYFGNLKYKRNFRRNKNTLTPEDEWTEIAPQYAPVFKTPRNLKELRWLSTERAKQVKELYEKLKQTDDLEG